VRDKSVGAIEKTIEKGFGQVVDRLNAGHKLYVAIINSVGQH
jgi:hypothetical protein